MYFCRIEDCGFVCFVVYECRCAGAENYGSVSAGYVMYRHEVLAYAGVCDRRECEGFIHVRLDRHGSGVCGGRRGGRGSVSGHACGKGVHGWCCLCNLSRAGAPVKNVYHALVIVLGCG